MSGIAFDILPQDILLVPIIVGLITLWWSKEILVILRRHAKIITFARTLPTPRIIPLIGNYQVFYNTDEFVHLLTKWSRELKGTYTLWLGPKPKIVITDPRDFEIILMSPLAAKKDPDIYGIFNSIVVDTLINGHGARYRAHKKLVMPFVNGKPLPNFIKVFNKHTNRFNKILGDKVDCGEFDLWKSVDHCVGDIVFETLFGVPGEAQNGRANEAFLHGSERLMYITIQRITRPWEHSNFIFRKIGGNSREWYSTSMEMHQFVGDTIRQKKEKYTDAIRQNMEPKVETSLCDLLVDNMMKTNSWTDTDLIDELLTIFVGSHDTILGVASFVFLMLAMHPDIQEKVRKETEEVVGDGIIDQQATINMKYLDMVIQETMRLFPAGPYLPRRVTGELKLTTCTVPEGSSLFMLPFATHRDPAYWIDPEKFNPERFTPENSKNRHDFAFVPFSGGIRMCPAYKYGIACLKVMIADAIRHYNFSTSRKMEDIKLNVSISVRCANGFPVSIKKI